MAGIKGHYTGQDAAYLLREEIGDDAITIRTLDHLAKQHRGPPFKTFGRQSACSEEDLMKYIEEEKARRSK